MIPIKSKAGYFVLKTLTKLVKLNAYFSASFFINIGSVK